MVGMQQVRKDFIPKETPHLNIRYLIYIDNNIFIYIYIFIQIADAIIMLYDINNEQSFLDI